MMQRRVSIGGRKAAAAAALCSLALLGFAPDTSAQGTLPTVPPISSDCQTPGVSISGDIPLPAVTRALKERKLIKILAIGASSAGGREASDNSYTHTIETVLEKAMPGLDVKIVNRGFSGELARDAADRLRTQVALVKPDIVLWQLGTHDALLQVPVDEFTETVGDTLKWLREHDTDVVLVGLHYLRRLAEDTHYQAIRAALSKLSEENKVLRIGRYEAAQVIEQLRSSGKQAPNEFSITEGGYACLAEYVARAVTTGVYGRAKGGGKPN